MFARKLAWRYIKEQKRHSVLTICSITAAVGLVVMLFTLLGTTLRCCYEIQYNSTPFHATVTAIIDNKEQREYINNFVEDFRENYGTADLYIEEAEDDISRIDIYCFFDKPLPISTGSRLDLFIADMLAKSGFDRNEIAVESDRDIARRIFIIKSNLSLYNPIDNVDRAQWIVIIAVAMVFVAFIIIALRMLIDTAFEISSKERERQFGVLQSIGATPKQITQIMTVEGLFLSVVGILLGIALGIAAAYLVFVLVIKSGVAEAFFTTELAEKALNFHIEPIMLVIAVVVGFLWVMLSAYGTGLRVIKKMPVEAISARSNTVKKIKNNTVFGKLFGWEGMLASRNNFRQKKRFTISVVSLTASITLFASATTAITAVKDVILKRGDNTSGILSEFRFNYYRPYDNSKLKQDIGYQKYGMFMYHEREDRIKKSGIFTEPMYMISTFLECADKSETVDENTYYKIVYFNFLNREMYEKIFEGKPPVSYDELSKNNSYIMYDNNGEYTGFSSDTFVFNALENVRIEEEYKDDIRSEYADKFIYDGINDYVFSEETEQSVNVAAYVDTQELSKYLHLSIGSEVTFIGTADSFESGEYMREPDLMMLSNSAPHDVYFYCDLLDADDYQLAADFYDKNKDAFIDYSDEFESMRRTVAFVSAVNIIATALNIIFALIAVINMINILSTGIINRRREIAAYQCIGMSEKQLNKMTILESLQYVFVSGIVSMILCEVIMVLTVVLMNIVAGGAENAVDYLFGNMFNAFVMPVLRVITALVPAFLAALLASFIPLRKLKKQPLVER